MVYCGEVNFDQFQSCHPCTLLQCKPDISRSCISRNWIYRGRMLDPIFLPTDFANFADVAPKSAIFFREIAVTPCIQFAGDNFSLNLLTAIAFVPVRWRQFFAKSTRAYLSMRAGTLAVRWAATLGGALTPPLCRIPQQIKRAWLVDIPLAVHAHQNKAIFMTPND